MRLSVSRAAFALLLTGLPLDLRAEAPGGVADALAVLPRPVPMVAARTERPAFLARGALAALTQGGSQESARVRLQALLALEPARGSYQAAEAARALAEGALAFRTQDPALAARLRAGAEALLGPVEGWLEAYPGTVPVHDSLEPAWIQGRPEVVAQAILGWIALEQGGPVSGRREVIARMAEGLRKLYRSPFSRYPFGAHFSYVTSEGRPRTYLIPGSGDLVAGASWTVEQNAVALALARAGRWLESPELIASAEREGLGLLAMLAISGQIPQGFAPIPEGPVNSPAAVAAVTEGLAALCQGGERPLFGRLAGLAGSLGRSGEAPPSEEERAGQALIQAALRGAGQASWGRAVELGRPLGAVVVEAEAGRAVQKAFEEVPILYPGGSPGALAVVGRDNMFWMRFDLEREGDYLFYLSFLKSTVSGGLVSVMMRIDGDRIFQVPLGGATGDPYVDLDLVAGPRPLRAGPHSLGIRFSGLLMNRPAVLDSVMVLPAVERRAVRLPDGRGALVLKSLAEESLRVRVPELDGGGRPEISLVSGLGNPVQPRLTTDRRGRSWLEMPAGGVGFLIWAEGIPEVGRREEGRE